MALRRGTTAVKKIMRGTTAVKKVYRGTVLIWEATIYPQSGTWGPTALSTGYTAVATHTVAETGTYTLTHTIPSTAGANVTVRIAGPWGTSTGNLVPTAGGSSTVTTSQTITAGAAIQFQAAGSGSNTGSWSITKTAPLY